MSQQFQVPQFIEHEARIIGPFTVKQTALIAGVGAILFVLWFALEKWLFFIIGIPFSFLALLFGFMKINGRPLMDFFMSFFSFFISPQLYIWEKRRLAREKKAKRQQETQVFEGADTKITKKEIEELAKKLDQ